MILTIIGFFEAVIFLFIFYLAWKVFKRIFLPAFMKEMINKMQNQVNQQVHQREEPSRKAGDVTIDYEPRKEKKVSHDDGEYIDYEEVK